MVLAAVLLALLPGVVAQGDGGDDDELIPCLFRPSHQMQESLEKQFRCLGKHMVTADATDKVLDIVGIQDEGKSQGLVFFGARNSAANHAVEMMADALFGPSKHGFLSINLVKELQSTGFAVDKTRSNIKDQIRRQIEDRCLQRSLLLFTGLEGLAKKQLPVLDVLLDMLNNERPFLQVGDTTLDCGGVTVVLLFEEELKLTAGWEFKEELEKRWAFDGENLLDFVSVTSKPEKYAFCSTSPPLFALGHEFTHGALIGRLSEGIVFGAEPKLTPTTDLSACASAVLKHPPVDPAAAAVKRKAHKEKAKGGAQTQGNMLVMIVGALVVFGVGAMVSGKKQEWARPDKNGGNSVATGSSSSSSNNSGSHKQSNSHSSLHQRKAGKSASPGRPLQSKGAASGVTRAKGGRGGGLFSPPAKSKGRSAAGASTAGSSKAKGRGRSKSPYRK